MRKIIALTSTIILTLFFTLSFFPETAFAADATIIEDGTYDISTFDDGATVTINDGLSVTLTNTTAISNKNLKLYCTGANTHLTIISISIKPSFGCSLAFTGEGNTLILSGSSSLISSGYEPGIRVESDTSLEISGSGILEVTGGNDSAGIGAACNSKIGKITINDGTIIANGGTETSYGGGAGIGGGSYSSPGEITITGGTVTANGNYKAAGIGGGYSSSAGIITISGGTITANGGFSGAGIGHGIHSGPGSTEIIISGGKITANGGQGGAGIGAGGGGSSPRVVIKKSAQVTATGGLDGAGIGGGATGKADSITITEGACVTAQGGDNASGIGSGGYSSGGGSVHINNGANVTATGGDNGAGIGGGIEASIASISINNADVTACGGLNAPGIGSGYNAVYRMPQYISVDSSKVFAGAGDGANYDIGSNLSSTFITLTGSSSVFLKNDLISISLYSDLTHFNYTLVDSDNKILKIEMPSGWLGAGGYHQEYITVSYNINGASGDTPQNASILKGASTSLPTLSSFNKDNMSLISWNTNPNGSGEGYSPGCKYNFTEDVTLYAIWIDKDVTSVEINAEDISLSKNETCKLYAEVLPSDATKKAVSWSTSDGSIAAINSNGLVTAISEGRCTITASADGVTDTCTVRVRKIDITSVSLNYDSKTVNVGEVFSLTAIILPNDSSDEQITWDSSDYTIARVNSYGVATAEGVGTCEITATVEDKTAVCKVYVSSVDTAVESVSLSMGGDTVMVMYVGDTTVLSANVSPSNADDKSVTWQSTNSSVASVSSTGKVTAIAVGETTVTVTAGGKSASYRVLVKSLEGEEKSLIEESVIAMPTPLPVEIVYTVQIDTTSLPYGAQYVELPNGEIVELNGEDTISCKVCAKDLKNGNINIIALDSDKNALGPVDVSAETNGNTTLWFIIIAIGAVILGAGGMLVLVRYTAAKKR